MKKKNEKMLVVFHYDVALEILQLSIYQKFKRNCIYILDITIGMWCG